MKSDIAKFELVMMILKYKNITTVEQNDLLFYDGWMFLCIKVSQTVANPRYRARYNNTSGSL